MAPRLTDLPLTYQSLFQEGRFPEAGTLFPAAVAPVADSLFAVLVGLPLMAFGAAPFFVSRAPTGTLLALIPVMLGGVAGGVRAGVSALRAWREAAARKNGRCHYGIWLDDEAMVVRLPGHIGADLVAFLPRQSVREARLMRYRSRDAVTVEPVIHFQAEGRLSTLALPQNAFGEATASTLLDTVTTWAEGRAA
jgi:hypothetical protein